MALEIYTAPEDTRGKVVLGRTLPRLLDDAVEKHPNPKGFNQPIEGGDWWTFSNEEFRTIADEIAAGLVAWGLRQGEHVAMLMDSDVYFSQVDFGTLIAGLVNVPLYVTFAEENFVFITNHSESKVMFVSSPERLEQYAAWAEQVPDIRLVVLVEGEPEGIELPEGQKVLTLEKLRAEGREKLVEEPELPRKLRGRIKAGDLATLVYTSGTTGRPKGVMLTHENITSNAYGAFTSFGILEHEQEQYFTFLPLSHIFARMLSLASAAWGMTIYYSDPDHIVEHLPAVRPTLFAVVPRVLEKVYERILLGIEEAGGVQKKIGQWAIRLASEYDQENPPTGLAKFKYAVADRLVYSKLRERLGMTRVKVCVSGGAALRGELSNSFTALGVPVYQGYGLTETSPVIAVAVPGANQPGTVGPPIAGVEVAIADDGEILTRGPHIMKGYYKEPEKTAEVLDGDNWFHTGDIGEVTPEGSLKITDRKKSLFKLSTGKFVIPKPIENRLIESPLIEQAVVIGEGEKYCAALLFPSAETLRGWARKNGVQGGEDIQDLLSREEVLVEYETLVAEANRGMDHWSQVKRFTLMPELMSVENGLLTPKLSVKMRVVLDEYADVIQRMYAADVESRSGTGVAAVA